MTKEEVPTAVLDKEKEIYKAQAAAAGKPANVQDKIAEGKLKDYYTQFCLLEQPFVKEPKLTIGQLVQEKIAVIKENIVVRRFARFRVGEEVAGQAMPRRGSSPRRAVDSAPEEAASCPPPRRTSPTSESS